MVGFKIFLALSFSTILKFDLCQSQYNLTKSLELVVTIFRHGDRTIDINPDYTKDSYRNETYFPYGYGELTSTGKRRIYKLGKTLREEYESFLGSLYVPGLIKAVSTDVSRTKCSLQLFLSSLFPPSDTILEWNTNLNWNPIPFDYVSLENNRLLSFPYVSCPNYQVLYKAYQQTPEVLAIENYYKPMYSYISQNSGINVTSIYQLFRLYFVLICEDEWGLTLPEWTKAVYPDYMKNAVEDTYRTFTGTPQLNQLFGGFLLKKTINDMYQKINGTTSQPKMYVYSGHEISIVSILGALNLYYPHVPKYGACVIIELHKINQQHYVKVRYNKNNLNKFVDLKISGCTTMCPLKKFINLLKEHIPEDGDPCVT